MQMSSIYYSDLFTQKSETLGRFFEAASKMGAPVITQHVYKSGQDIFYSGTEPFGVYYLHHGLVKLFKSGEAGRRHITFLGATGDLFGYRALLAGELYKVTAEAILESKVSFIEKGFFFEFLRQDPVLTSLLFKTICVELGDVEDRLVGAVQVHAEQRVARVLYFLIKNYGTDKNGFLTLELSRSDMSELSDVTPETLMRYLGRLDKKKIIRRDKKRIKILDPDAIQKEARFSRKI